MPEIPASLVPLARLGVRGLAALPRGAKQRIAGEPIVIDGQRLDTDVQLVFTLAARLGKQAYYELPLDEARHQADAESELVAPPPPALRELRRLSVAGAEGRLEARLYVPHDAADPGGLLVVFHGGGWVIGSLNGHEPAFALLARDSGVRVLSVDYRLAPEHRFPAGVEDALAAYHWAVEHAAELGGDPRRIGVGGDSAGGNLAAVVAQQAAADEMPPSFQALLYPVCDVTGQTRSEVLFGEGFFLSKAQMDWYEYRYLGDPSEASDPRVSPLLAPELSSLAPAYVAVAGFDPLRDEGIAYAQRLREAGVEVELRIHRDLEHAFINMTAISRAAAAASGDAAAALRSALGG